MRSKAIRAQRAQIITDARALVDKDGATAEDMAKFDTVMASADALQTQISALDRLDAIDAELAQHRAVVTDTTGASADEQDDKAKREKRLFVAWALGNVSALSEADRKVITQRAQPDSRFSNAASVGTPSSGGYTVAPDFMRELLIAQKAFGGMRGVARTIATDTGVVLPWPTMDDTGNVATIVGENTAGVSGTDLAFNSVSMNAWTWRSGFLVLSLEILQDSAFDFDSLIRDALAMRFARGQNTAFTLGAGAAGPQGVVVGTPVGTTGAAGQTTSVIYDDLVNLQHSIDPAYRAGAVFMMHDSTVKVIRKLKDGNGRPLWIDTPEEPAGITGGIPALLLNAPIIVNQDMPVMGANAKSILYGNFQNYLIRDVLGLRITRLNERFAENGQVGFVAFQRNDGRMITAAQPIKSYQNSAT